jgi:hypothetical protein
MGGGQCPQRQGHWGDAAVVGLTRLLGDYGGVSA